jgi:hypothetical protein
MAEHRPSTTKSSDRRSRLLSGYGSQQRFHCATPNRVCFCTSSWSSSTFVPQRSFWHRLSKISFESTQCISLHTSHVLRNPEYTTQTCNDLLPLFIQLSSCADRHSHFVCHLFSLSSSTEPACVFFIDISVRSKTTVMHSFADSLPVRHVPPSSSGQPTETTESQILPVDHLRHADSFLRSQCLHHSQTPVRLTNHLRSRIPVTLLQETLLTKRWPHQCLNHFHDCSAACSFITSHGMSSLVARPFTNKDHVTARVSAIPMSAQLVLHYLSVSTLALKRSKQIRKDLPTLLHQCSLHYAVRPADVRNAPLRLTIAITPPVNAVVSPTRKLKVVQMTPMSNMPQRPETITNRSQAARHHHLLARSCSVSRLAPKLIGNAAHSQAKRKHGSLANWPTSRLVRSRLDFSNSLLTTWHLGLLAHCTVWHLGSLLDLLLWSLLLATCTSSPRPKCHVSPYQTLQPMSVGSSMNWSSRHPLVQPVRLVSDRPPGHLGICSLDSSDRHLVTCTVVCSC